LRFLADASSIRIRMSRRFALVLAVALASGLASAAPRLSPEEEARWRQEVEEARKETQEWLRSDPSSYLAAIRRVSFGEKTVLTVGSDSSNDVVLEGLSPKHLRLTVSDVSFAVAAVDDGATFTLGKDAAPRREATTGPALVGLGRFGLRLSHQGYPAVIVMDSKSPRFAEYKPVPFYPIDPAYRYVLKLIPDPKAQATDIASTASGRRRAVRVGWFSFAVGKKRVRLAAHRMLEPGPAPDSLSVYFRDATTGKGSYEVGRYVEPKKQADGTYVLDFNTAYSPACAYSSYYNCPIPPAENQLSVAIRAGEKDPRYH